MSHLLFKLDSDGSVHRLRLGFPFMMVIALGGMQGIPQELYEAARIDRVSRFRQFLLYYAAIVASGARASGHAWSNLDLQ